MYVYRGNASPALNQGGAAAAPAAAAVKGGTGSACGTSAAAAAPARKKRKQPGSSEASASGKGRAATSAAAVSGVAAATAGAALTAVGCSAPSPLGSGGRPELEVVLEQVPKWQLLLDVLVEAQSRRATWREEAAHRQSSPKSDGGEGRRSVAATTLGDDGDGQGSDGDSDVVEVAAPGAGSSEHDSGDGSVKAHQSWDGGWWMARVM